MRIKKKLLGVALAVTMAVGCIPNVASAKATNIDFNAIKIVDTTRVIEKNRRTAYVAEQFAKKTPNRFQIGFTKDFATEWCARFASYCVGDHNITNDSNVRDSCTNMRNYYRDVKKTYYEVGSGYIPSIGDLVFFEKNKKPNDGPEHVGIVVKVIRGEGELGYKIETVEGNYKDSTGDNYNTSYVKRVPKDEVFYKGDDGCGIIGYAKPYAPGEIYSYRAGDTNGRYGVTQVDATYILRMCEGDFKFLNFDPDTCMCVLRGDVTYNDEIGKDDAEIIMKWILYNDMHR